MKKVIIVDSPLKKKIYMAGPLKMVHSTLTCHVIGRVSKRKSLVCEWSGINDNIFVCFAGFAWEADWESVYWGGVYSDSNG